MNYLDKYLKEKEEYFFPKTEESIPDKSDYTLNADEFMYSKSDHQSYYSKGNGSEFNDNQEFYEVIKIVKDMTDKHLYNRDLSWKVNVGKGKAEFIFTVGEDVDSKESNDFFMKGIEQHLLLNIFKKFGTIFKVESGFFKDDDGKDILKIIVIRDKDEERTDINSIKINPKDSSGFYGKYTNISTM